MPGQSRENQVYVMSVTIPIVPNTMEKAQELLGDFKEFMKSNDNIQDGIWQLERGVQEQKLHIQGYIKLKTKDRPLSMGMRLGSDGFPGIHVTACSSAGKEALRSYCMKDDTRVEGPFGVRPIYMGEDVWCVGTNPNRFQQWALNILKSRANDRKIIWVFNPQGNIGKSLLTKYCQWKGLAARVPEGSAAQMKTFVTTLGAKPGYICDIPRVSGKDERQTDLFSLLESIKNGFVQGCMYGKIEELLMLPAHVICFSNTVPNLHHASRDRWEVYKAIRSDQTPTRMTVSEIVNEYNVNLRRKAQQELRYDDFIDEDIPMDNIFTTPDGNYNLSPVRDTPATVLVTPELRSRRNRLETNPLAIDLSLDD